MRKTVSFGAKPGAASTTPSVDDWVSSAGDASLDPAASRERMKRLTIDVPLGLHARIKSQCALRGVNMADEIRALLERHFPEGDA